MSEETEKEPLYPSTSQADTTYRDYLLGIIYAIGFALLYAVTLLGIKNINNQEGQHIRPEETLLPRALIFLPAAIIFLVVNKISLFGLEKKAYLILNLLGILTTIIIQCYNLALYSMSVGDVQTISFLKIVSTMVMERIFRRKGITLWKAIFSVGVILGGGLIAQPTLGNQSLSKNQIEGGSLTLLGVKDFLSNRLVGLLIIFVGFNIEAAEGILINMIKDTSPALIMLHFAIWKLLLFPLSQILLPSPGRLYTLEMWNFIQYDLVYHIGLGFCMLLAWIFAILSLQRISPVIYTVVTASSLIFDYGGQAVIDGTIPNTMAWWGIIITVTSVVLLLMENVIFRKFAHISETQE